MVSACYIVVGEPSLNVLEDMVCAVKKVLFEFACLDRICYCFFTISDDRDFPVEFLKLKTSKSNCGPLSTSCHVL